MHIAHDSNMSSKVSAYFRPASYLLYQFGMYHELSLSLRLSLSKSMNGIVTTDDTDSCSFRLLKIN